MNSKGLLVVAVVIIILAGGGWYLYAHKTPAPAPADTSTAAMENTQPAETTSSTTGVALDVSAGATVGSKTVTVTYTDQGFSPKSVTINKGDTVQFVDKRTQPMWVASDVHPTHEGYSGTTRSAHCPDTAGTSFDQCSPGMGYSFTFAKVGTWNYHNHIAAGDVGTVVVK